MSDEPKIEFYRRLSTDNLALYRGALVNDLRAAGRRPGHARYSAEYCQARIEAIDQVAGERGLTPAELEARVRELTK